ncbi:MAG: dTMP kinase [Candidatus Omnitrophica bacterium]|nr:dTMP kinase [Candidatus Omnitrophota bacterium]
MKKMKKGFLLTFEGAEGCGKSTQIRFAGRWLKRKGYRVELVREPGGTPVAEAIRNILLHGKGAMSSATETFLFLAARRDLVEKKIRPALKAGNIVLSDRFQDSTWVYQTYAGNFPRSAFEKAGREATGGLEPDLTFIFDVPVRVGLGRAGKTDRIEKKSLAFHERVRKGYLEIAKRHKRRSVLIPHQEGASKVSAEVEKVLSRVFK